MFDLVSIVMPTYNSSEFVVESIFSIQAQTYTNWELLITDDCSSDKTVKLIQNLASMDSRIKVFQLTENGGAGVARNHSLEKAAGRYIAFLDSDDLWAPEKLEKQLMFMAQLNADFSFTAYNHIDIAGDFLKKIEVPASVDHRSLLIGNVIATSTVIIRREAFQDLNMPNFPRAQDFALWLKLLREVAKAYGLKESLSDYRVTPNTGNRRKFFALKYLYNIFTKQEKKSPIGSGILIFRMYLHRVAKYWNR